MATDPLRLLFCDEFLVAIDKPSGAVVHRTRGAPADSPILVSVLADQLGQKLYPVHRLDRQTSGVMVFALSTGAASRMAQDIREGRWQKQYLALCRGPLLEPIAVDHPVREGDKRRPAQTDITPVEHFCGRYSLVRAFPKTGRRHQLRYHFKHLGHPLVGDTNYGKGPINRFFRQTFGLGRLFLHAEKLTFCHPMYPQMLQIDQPLAEDLRHCLQQLRAHVGAVA